MVLYFLSLNSWSIIVIFNLASLAIIIVCVIWTSLPFRAILAEYSGAILGVLSGVLYGRRGHVWKKVYTIYSLVWFRNLFKELSVWLRARCDSPILGFIVRTWHDGTIDLSSLAWIYQFPGWVFLDNYCTCPCFLVPTRNASMWLCGSCSVVALPSPLMVSYLELRALCAFRNN